MSRGRQSFPKKTHARNASLSNNPNESQYSNEQSMGFSSPYFIHETFIQMLQKIIQLTELLIKGDLNSSSSQIYHKPPLINLTQKKKSVKNFSPSTPPLATTVREVDKYGNKFSDLRNDFQKIRQKILEYKSSNSFKKITGESPIIRRSIQIQEFEINMIKMEEQCQKQFKEIKERMGTVEEDMGQLLMLYKEILFAK